jgi:hypothetical protein
LCSKALKALVGKDYQSSMGSILIARCKCGFSQQFGAGGGFQSFETFCAAPAVCQDCQSFTVTNYLDPNAKCPKGHTNIVFYNDPQLSKPKTATSPQVFSWNIKGPRPSLELKTGPYYCPACKKFALKFEMGGCWD